MPHREVCFVNPKFSRFDVDIRETLPGTGSYKLGVNYAPGVMPQQMAAALGYVQNLWLHGPEHYLTEVQGTTDLHRLY